MMATSVVLSVLSVPAYDRALFGRQDEMAAEQEKERTLKMASILGFAVVRGQALGPCVCVRVRVRGCVVVWW